MQIDLPPVQIDRIRQGNLHTSFCFDDCIATLSKYIGRDFELMYSGSWSFGFDPADSSCLSSIGKRVRIDRLNKYRLLEKYHGITLTDNNLPESEGIDCIKSNLESGKPVILIIDCFWCPWDPGFRKYHNSGHSFLITGFDEERNTFKCTDGYYMKKDLCLPIDCYSKGFVGTASYSVAPEPAVGSPAEIVKNCAEALIQDNNGVNCFEQMRDFGRELLHLNPEIELEGYDSFWETPVWYAFDSIISSRIEYAISLKYAADKEGGAVFEGIEDMLCRLIERWNVCKGMLSKIFSSDRRAGEVQKRLCNRVLEAAEKEEEIAGLIVKTNRNLRTAKDVFIADRECDNTVMPYYQSSCVFIDLSNFKNNKAFDIYPSSGATADFTGHGHYFIYDGLLGEDILKIGERAFKVNIKPFDCYDNVSCSEQNIPVPEGIYNRIFIMGCAEYGDYSDTLKIQLKDDRCLELPIMFYEWSHSANNDTAAWEGKIAEKKDGEWVSGNRLHKIYAKGYRLDCNTEVSSIRLPDCPNIHIFAITMQK